MSRVVVVGGWPESLLNFRGHLLSALVTAGHDVTAMAAAADPPLVKRIEDLGVRFRPFPIRRNAVDPIADLRTYRALRAAFKDVRPDVVLAYTAKPIIWGGLALRGTGQTRFYALVTGLGFAFQDGGPARRFLTALVTGLYRLALARASHVVFQNGDNRDEFVTRGIVPRPRTAVVNGSGVDLVRFARASLPGGPPTFLALGRLLGDKGFREYAQAARRVRLQYPNAVFRLLGMPDPSPDAIPLDEVRSWEASGWIEYLPATDDVRPALSACHVFVLPSYHEGMPRSVLEALATGRPIVTTDVPGCRETVVPGKNGYLIPSADASALAERLEWMIEHREVWHEMAVQSRTLAEARFDVHAINRQLITLMNLQASHN